LRPAPQMNSPAHAGKGFPYIRARTNCERAELKSGGCLKRRMDPAPPLKTLEYAGVCIQAREVGGDYYDFLNLGPQRLGLVIGDISGKGIAAALLMANLQANLRSQCAMAIGGRRVSSDNDSIAQDSESTAPTYRQSRRR
jgi:hypothetical protein